MAEAVWTRHPAYPVTKDAQSDPHHYPYDCSTGMTWDNPFANTLSGQHPLSRGSLVVVVHRPTNIAIPVLTLHNLVAASLYRHFSVEFALSWISNARPRILLCLYAARLATCYQSFSSCLAYFISSQSVKVVYLYSNPLFL